jgi:hypothetical protein
MWSTMDSKYFRIFVIVMIGGTVAQSVVMHFSGFSALTVAQAITLIVLNVGGIVAVIHFAHATNPPKTGKALFSLIIAVFVMLVSFAELYRTIGIFENGERVADAVTCLYFSTVTWTTLGYGDIQPLGWSRLAAAVQALLGYVYLGVFVGLLLKLVVENSIRAERQS